MTGVREAAASPCRACPWRLSNQGTKTPGGWYSRRNIDRLWAGLRRGASMSCHPTDPRMSDVADQGYDGFRPAPETADVRECAGALIMVQREFMLLQGPYDASIAAYRRARPRGLTREGVIAMLNRVIFDGTVLGGGVKLTKPNLADLDIGHSALPWAIDDIRPIA